MRPRRLPAAAGGGGVKNRGGDYLSYRIRETAPGGAYLQLLDITHELAEGAGADEIYRTSRQDLEDRTIASR